MIEAIELQATVVGIHEKITIPKKSEVASDPLDASSIIKGSPQNIVEGQQPRFSPDKVDLHRHAEGSVYLSTIISLAEKYQVPFEQSTINSMRRAFENTNQKKSLENFINRLSTKWMRLLIAKIMISSHSSKQMIISCIGDFYDSILADAKEFENIQALNILFCPFALSIDGDFSKNSLQAKLNSNDPSNLLTMEERKVYTTLLQHYSHLQNKGVSWKEYVERVGEFKNANTHTEYSPKIFITVSFRRDRDYQKLTNPDLYIRIAEELQTAFILGKIDFVDICGLESSKYPFSSFNPFIRELDKRFIPHTRHAGEVHNSNRTLGYENLNQIYPDENMSKWIFPPRIVAHAVRLLDKRRQAEKIYTQFTKNDRIAIAVNAVSNIETGLFPSVREHRFLINLLQNPAAIENLLFFLSTDDPVIHSFTPQNSITDEFNIVMDAVQQMWEGKEGKNMVLSPQEFIEQLEMMINYVIQKLESVVFLNRIMSKREKYEKERRLLLAH